MRTSRVFALMLLAIPPIFGVAHFVRGLASFTSFLVGCADIGALHLVSVFYLFYHMKIFNRKLSYLKRPLTYQFAF